MKSRGARETGFGPQTGGWGAGGTARRIISGRGWGGARLSRSNRYSQPLELRSSAGPKSRETLVAGGQPWPKSSVPAGSRAGVRWSQLGPGIPWRGPRARPGSCCDMGRRPVRLRLDLACCPPTPPPQVGREPTPEGSMLLRLRHAALVLHTKSPSKPRGCSMNEFSGARCRWALRQAESWRQEKEMSKWGGMIQR